MTTKPSAATAPELRRDVKRLRAALDGLINDFLNATANEWPVNEKKYPAYVEALLAFAETGYRRRSFRK